MKKLKPGFLLLLIAFGVSYARAQTADEIIGKYLDAIGGRDKLKSITSEKSENLVEVMGNESPSTTTVLNGKGYRNESEFNGSKIIQVYTTTGGWMVSPNSSDPQAMSDDQYKGGKDNIYVTPLLDYADRGAKAELMGEEKLGDRNAYKIKLTSADSISTVYYLDDSTYYLVKAVRTGEMMGQPTEISLTFSKPKKTDFGVIVPQQIDLDFGGQFSLTINLQKVEFNVAVDDSIFEMPKQ